MSKKDEFKEFAKVHPELISRVKSGNTSWQKLYEIYDIYGTDDEAWETYLKEPNGINNIGDIVKNFDMDSLQKHINTAQKALGLVQEMTSKSGTASSTVNVTPRPINKFFED